MLINVMLIKKKTCIWSGTSHTKKRVVKGPERLIGSDWVGDEGLFLDECGTAKMFPLVF